MEPKTNYLIVGIFVLIFTGALIGVILWLTADKGKKQHIYTIYVKESVAGLSIQAPVRFNGVDVGDVSNIRISSRNAQEVRIDVTIDDGTPVNESTRAVLKAQGITGIMYVGLKNTTPDAQPLKTLPDEAYPVILSEPSLLVQVDAAASELAEGFQNISGNLQKLLNDKNQAEIADILKNFNKMTNMMANQGGLQHITTSLEDTQTTLQNFNEQLLPALSQNMNQLTQVLLELEPTLRKLKDSPSILVRGVQQPALGPGEQ